MDLECKDSKSSDGMVFCFFTFFTDLGENSDKVVHAKPYNKSKDIATIEKKNKIKKEDITETTKNIKGNYISS